MGSALELLSAPILELRSATDCPTSQFAVIEGVVHRLLKENVVETIEVARQLEEGVVVTIFCDSGDKYMSTPMWQLEFDEAIGRREQ